MSIKSRVQHYRFESPAQEAVVSLIVTATLLLQQMNALLAEYGITHDQYNVLRILRGAEPNGLPRNEVGKRLMTRAPDVTRLLDRLERQGFVVRGWAPENRRLSIARITKSGLALLAKVDPVLHAWQRTSMGGVSDQQLSALARTCSTIAEGIT